ncbi:hypothetical protein BT69DRAFT_1217100, partial [Atractiella rhizophila]
PCDVFDLICGTSTGGWIALMLGRLGMIVRECISEYEQIVQQVFSEEARPQSRKKAACTLQQGSKPSSSTSLLDIPHYLSRHPIFL